MTLLAVRPHPDDESTSTGGMLAYYSVRDVRTGVVICTESEEGEIHDPDLDSVADRSRLRELRTQEVKDALRFLVWLSFGCSATMIRGWRARPPINTRKRL